MKINPDDPWYPIPAATELHTDVPGVTIRLKLAADTLKSPLLGEYAVARNLSLVNAAWEMADDWIARANRDEGSNDDVRDV